MEEIKYEQTQTKMLGQGARRSPAGRVSARGNNDMFVANVAEKRYLWTARAFAVITALSLCCNIVLLLAIFQVMPLYRVEPFLLSFQNQEEQVYNIMPITTELRNRKSITEIFVRDYVLQRSAFSRNLETVDTRWRAGGAIQEMSTPQVYQDFLDNVAKKAINMIRDKGMERKITILSINELSDNIWQVEYQAEDTYPESVKPEVSYWTASLTVGYRRKTVKYGERLKNPLGFTVIKYALSRNSRG